MPFKINQDRTKEIAKRFDVDPKLVKNVHDMYANEIVPLLQDQYLAHLCRALEEFLRSKGESDSFTIRLKSIKRKSGFGGRIQYIKEREDKTAQYMIHYYDQIEDLQKRIIISHELGHILFAIIFKHQNDGKIDPNTIEHVEPLSSLLGFFALLDRSDFYKESSGTFTHTSFEKLLSDFSLIHNGKHKE